MGPDGKLMHVNPLTLEPSWRLPLPPKSPGARKPEWDDRCCTAGEGGLQVALAHDGARHEPEASDCLLIAF
jgi:hypothetical protein